MWRARLVRSGLRLGLMMMMMWRNMLGYQVLPTRLPSPLHHHNSNKRVHHHSNSRHNHLQNKHSFKSEKLTTTTTPLTIMETTRHPLPIHPAHNERHSHQNSSLGQVLITRTIPSIRRRKENDLIPRLRSMPAWPPPTIIPPPLPIPKSTTTTIHHPTCPQPHLPKEDTTCTRKSISKQNQKRNPTLHLPQQYQEIDPHSAPIPILVST
mmetsp:Transcript_11575/g.23195  ORF Transcript_11575/g.23195 Transcript_11575/m.23195 type:complete len:209 (+) Transcript_11575:736-1362(+)